MELSKPTFSINQDLIARHNEVRAHLNGWANTVSITKAARVRIKFELALLSAIDGDSEWQIDTSPELCEALGHRTLEGFLR